MHGCVATVFGISGVGKTTMISGFTRKHPWVHAVRASSLLMSATHSVDSERLRAAPASEVSANQEQLVSAFSNLRAAHPDRHVIFDGHSIVDNDQGLLVIPTDVIVRLRPNAVVFIEENPNVIAARRAADTARIRPIRTVDELTAHQALAKETAHSYAKTLLLSFQVIGSSDPETFERSMLQVFSTNRIKPAT